MNKIIKYALAVMAFLENLAQAVAAFFKEHIFPFFRPLWKKLSPFGKKLQRFFTPVFDFLKVHPIITVILIGIVYFIGIAAVLYPVAGNIYTLRHSIMAISQYDKAIEEMDTSEIEQRLNNARIYNADLAAGIYNDGYERSLCSISDLMCFVEVPSVDIYLPVYYGTSEEVLQKGCGWLENTSLPVDGENVHSVISGHTGLPNAELFTKLDQVKKDDVFYIHVLNQVFAYQVREIFIVLPNQSSYLDIVPQKEYCTLLTCTPYGINDKRLLVRGERIPYIAPTDGVAQSKSTKSSVNDIDEEIQQQILHQLIIIIGIVIVAVIVYVFACIWLFKVIHNPTDGFMDLVIDDDLEDSDGEES